MSRRQGRKGGGGSRRPRKPLFKPDDLPPLDPNATLAEFVSRIHQKYRNRDVWFPSREVRVNNAGARNQKARVLMKTSFGKDFVGRGKTLKEAKAQARRKFLKALGYPIEV